MVGGKRMFSPCRPRSSGRAFRGNCTAATTAVYRFPGRPFDVMRRIPLNRSEFLTNFFLHGATFDLPFAHCSSEPTIRRINRLSVSTFASAASNSINDLPVFFSNATTLG